MIAGLCGVAIFAAVGGHQADKGEPGPGGQAAQPPEKGHGQGDFQQRQPGNLPALDRIFGAYPHPAR